MAHVKDYSRNSQGKMTKIPLTACLSDKRRGLESETLIV